MIIAQDTIYFIQEWKECEKEEASYYFDVEKFSGTSAFEAKENAYKIDENEK